MRQLSAERRKTLVQRLVTAVAILLVGAVIGWAAALVLTPPHDLSDPSTYTYVEVEQGEVGSSINLNTVAEWTLTPVGSNQASGIVTSIAIEAGQEVSAGSALYTVGLRPVVIGQGAVPAFRPLSKGVTGDDVTQLQSLLATLGFYSSAVSGSYGNPTVAAVKAWQKSIGVPVDGVVQAGDVIWVPSLPTRVALDPKLVSRGASLGGGEAVLTGLPTQPDFVVPASEAQAALMPFGTRVEITAPGGEQWVAVVSGQSVDEFSSVNVELAGLEDAPICGDTCADVPVTGKTYLTSRVITVESVTGLRVPSAALLTTSGGGIQVIDEEGAKHPVTVVTSARGMSIIEGVAAGLKVRVPATDTDS